MGRVNSDKGNIKPSLELLHG